MIFVGWVPLLWGFVIRFWEMWDGDGGEYCFRRGWDRRTGGRWGEGAPAAEDPCVWLYYRVVGRGSGWGLMVCLGAWGVVGGM